MRFSDVSIRDVNAPTTTEMSTADSDRACLLCLNPRIARKAVMIAAERSMTGTISVRINRSVTESNGHCRPYGGFPRHDITLVLVYHSDASVMYFGVKMMSQITP